MTPSPIRKVLSIFRQRKVRALLMGGQACILYGAAEFTRDIDLAVAVDPENLDRLRAALSDLKARPLFFPELSPKTLRRGHACHFRCEDPEIQGLRVDVMYKMRGSAPFATLWKRRRNVKLSGIGTISVMSLSDLVRIKKTQRDKDWPMIRRLIEADVLRVGRKPDASRIRFWLLECRTYTLLRDLAQRFPAQAARLARRRPALNAALQGDEKKTNLSLRNEEIQEREEDRRYWAPLRRELERWRLTRLKKSALLP